MIQDKTPVDMQRRKILESLLPPASELIRQLGPDAAPRDYVKLLDSAYGLVEDGEEIFARFLNTHQNTGEKASEYLQRPKAWFCFKCGNDGHLARQCENPPNKLLVDQKYKELKLSFPKSVSS
uniref:CCHC-type domain-containing protein n=1 Tax=Cyprinus carpio TaxID=7962 RepID=A0A8C1SFS8_CYPCA